MRFQSILAFSVALICSIGLMGCEKSKKTGQASGAGGHQHTGSDELVWQLKEKIGDSDYEIWLGHHGTHFHGGDGIEPAVAIMKSGTAVADAKVFNSLAESANSEQLVADEVPTIYEPETPEEIAHYAQGELKIPDAATKCVIRYRIEMEGRPEYTRDITIEVGD